MHYHLEIIMPPSNNIEADVEKVMCPFYEGNENRTGNEFYNYYIIGGRWSGEKEMCGYNQESIDAFYKRLNDLNITVSGIVFGKQEISPASQIPLVDEIWNDFFPTENGEILPCPIFKHSNDPSVNIDEDMISCDICRVDEIPEKLMAERVIIAADGHKGTKWEGLEAVYMTSRSVWNGVIHIETKFNGNVKSVLKEFEEYTKRFREKYRKKVLPQPNWICITADYHS